MPTTKNALEVACVVREGRKFSVNSGLIQAKAVEGQEPLKIYDSRYSLFHLVMSDSTKGETKVVTANIRISQIEDIIRRTEYAMKAQMEAETAPKTAETGSSPAYTVKIKSGKYAGKTPAEILATNPGELDGLRSQWKWLQDNAQKYPANRTQMDAIQEAAGLLKAGKLSKAETGFRPTVSIYDAEARALIRKPRQDGFCPVYEVHISWSVGEKSPVTVKISNFYAPVKKLDGGRINPVVSQRDQNSVKDIFLNMTEWEWLDTIRAMKAHMRQFETLYARACLEDAWATDRQNREAARKNM